MKVEDLRTLDHDELSGRLKGARRELYELRFKLAVGQLDNHRQIRRVRKDIARILTVVHARRLGEEILEVPAEETEVVERAATATAVAEPETAAPEADASGEEQSEETPENVETPAPDSGEAPASPRSSRRRRASGEEGND